MTIESDVPAKRLPQPIPRPPKVTRPKPFARPWYNQPTIRILEIIGVLFAISAILFDIFWRFTVDRRITQQETIARAWQIVGEKNYGNSGKIAALETLAKDGVDLHAINLSCREENRQCRDNHYLRGVNLSVENIGYQVDLSFAKLRGVNLAGANLRGVNLKFSDLSDANLIGADLTGALMDQANISGTKFCTEKTTEVECAIGIQRTQLDQTWSWRNEPPVFGVDNSIFNKIVAKLCNPSYRADYNRDNGAGFPNGCQG